MSTTILHGPCSQAALTDVIWNGLFEQGARSLRCEALLAEQGWDFHGVTSPLHFLHYVPRTDVARQPTGLFHNNIVIA